MLIGVIADDFTGGSDIANTLAKGVGDEGGLRTAQYPGVPSVAASDGIDAAVVSLKSRSIPPDEAVRESLNALSWLIDQGCQQILFKYCSTFDSTPKGNIGPVADALSEALNASGVVVCPAFPTTGRTVYQGHLFVDDVLLNESGMQNHPLTPMIDPDIRRWLRRQTNSDVGHLPLSFVSKGTAYVRDALSESTAKFVVADAVSDDDLLIIGEALSEARLITGGSGIAMGLSRNFIGNGKCNPAKPSMTKNIGDAAILAGSCSGATRGQIEAHQKSHPVMPIDVPRVMSGDVGSSHLVEFVVANKGDEPLVYSSGTPSEVTKIQSKYGVEAVAEKLDRLFAETARTLVRMGYRRIVVAGGETSGAVAQAVAKELGSPAMKIGAEIDPGVPVLTLGQEQGVALALKSGNFGATDFFSKALRVMGGGDAI